MPIALLDQPQISSVLFHPRPESSIAREDDRTHTIRFTLPDGVALGGRLHSAAADAPVVLFFHGNGEIASDYDDLAKLYRQIGLSLLIVDYRGYGISGGRPSAETLISDALAVSGQAPELVARHGLSPARWLVMGRSLGSAPALAVAAESKTGPTFSGLIIESGFGETLPLVKRLGGTLPSDALESRDGFGNLTRIGQVTMPTLIIHGEEDYLIPFANGRRLFEASAATDKKLLPIANAGHNDLMIVGMSAYFSAIAQLSRR